MLIERWLNPSWKYCTFCPLFDCGPLFWELGGTTDTICIICDHLNSNFNQYFMKNSSHSELDLWDPNMYWLFTINVESQSISIVSHVSFFPLFLMFPYYICYESENQTKLLYAQYRGRICFCLPAPFFFFFKISNNLRLHVYPGQLS